MLPESPHYCGRYGLYAMAVVLEEVMTQYLRDAQKHFCVDCGTAEDFIDIGTIAAKLAGEPTDSSFLSAQFFLDEVTYVHSGCLAYHDALFCLLHPWQVISAFSTGHVTKKAWVLYLALPVLATQGVSHCPYCLTSNAQSPRYDV